MKIPGTVTINLDDYLELVEHTKKVSNLKTNTSRAAKEMSVFLSFLCSREDIATYIEEFNRQATTSKIILEGSRATIEFIDDKNEISDE
jgi:hypothetical protein